MVYTNFKGSFLYISEIRVVKNVSELHYELGAELPEQFMSLGNNLRSI